MGTLGGVDRPLEALEVGHHGPHHPARKAAADEQRGPLRIRRIDPVAEEIVYELLSQPPDLHICVHIDVLDQEAVRAEHLPDGDYVRMDLAPGKGLDGDVQVVGTGARDLQHGRGSEAGA